MKLIDLFSKMTSENDNYEQAQTLSDDIDKSLGFNVYEIEKELIDNAKQRFPNGDRSSWGKSVHNGSEAWIGLHPKQLQTTYNEIQLMLKEFNACDQFSICDLGAGYGRIGIYTAIHFPKSKFIGFELESRRVEEGNRIYKLIHANNSQLICANLVDIEIPICDIYFIYDFGIVSEIDLILDKLGEISKFNKIKIIARGRGVRTLIQNKHPWAYVNDSKVFDTFTIYST